MSLILIWFYELGSIWCLFVELPVLLPSIMLLAVKSSKIWSLILPVRWGRMFIYNPRGTECVSQRVRVKSNINNFFSVLVDKDGLWAPIAHQKLRMKSKMVSPHLLVSVLPHCWWWALASHPIISPIFSSVSRSLTVSSFNMTITYRGSPTTFSTLVTFQYSYFQWVRRVLNLLISFQFNASSFAPGYSSPSDAIMRL